MESLRSDIQARTDILEQKMETYRVYLDGRIDKLNQKFNFVIILIIIALALMHPAAAEAIKNLLKLM